MFILRITCYNFQTKCISFAKDCFAIANIVDPDETNNRFQSHISFFVNTFLKLLNFGKKLAMYF